MTKILMPTDFSKESKNSIKFIVDLLQENQVSAHIFLLNVYVIPKTNRDQVIQLNDQIKKISKINLEKMLKQTQNLIKDFNIQVTTISLMGSLSNTVQILIKQYKINLVVMGKDGGQHVENVTNTLRSSKSTCPLLINFH